MDLKVLCWNVEHFSGTKGGARKNRIKRVAELVEDSQADVFAIMEVEGKEVFDQMVTTFPNYSFTITKGTQIQEILIGVRHGISSFMTQKDSFKRSNPYLRPGALLTVTSPAGNQLPILFLHLKSLTLPEGFGLRDAMFINLKKLKKKIDERGGGSAPMAVVGDLNTMGMNLTFNKKDLSGSEEIARIEKVLASVGFSRVPKSHSFTFNKGAGSSLKSDLDHVFATSDLQFADQGGGAGVRVGGWALETTTAKQNDWIKKFSDHAPLIFKIKGL